MIEIDHLAFGAADISSTREDLVRLGFAPTEVSQCSWSHGGQPRVARAVSVVFAAQDLDFVEIQDAGWREHLASSTLYGRGVAPSGIVLRGLSPGDAIGIARRHLRVASIETSHRALQPFEGIDLEGAHVLLHEELGDPYLQEVARLLPASPARPVLLAAEIGVSDLGETRRSLLRSGAALVEEPDRLSLRPDEGHGTGLRFVA